MTNWTLSAAVVCPFYLREQRRIIFCEGLFQGTETALCFCSEASKLAHQRAVCCSWGFRSACPFASVLYGKYRGTEQRVQQPQHKNTTQQSASQITFFDNAQKEDT